MGKNKIIINLGLENEEQVYFDKFTKNKLNMILGAKNYVLLYFDKFFGKYIAYDFKATKEEQAIFNENLEKYCF